MTQNCADKCACPADILRDGIEADHGPGDGGGKVLNIKCADCAGDK